MLGFQNQPIISTANQIAETCLQKMQNRILHSQNRLLGLFAIAPRINYPNFNPIRSRKIRYGPMENEHFLAPLGFLRNFCTLMQIEAYFMHAHAT